MTVGNMSIVLMGSQIDLLFCAKAQVELAILFGLPVVVSQSHVDCVAKLSYIHQLVLEDDVTERAVFEEQIAN